jgi:hypothetical protein
MSDPWAGRSQATASPYVYGAAGIPLEQVSTENVVRYFYQGLPAEEHDAE